MKYTAKTETLENSRAKIVVTVAEADFESVLGKATKNALKEVEIKGFRKGHVPEDVFIKAYGKMPIRLEAAQLVIDDTYMNALTESKIQAVGRPEINLVQVEEGKDFIYELEVDVLSEFVLPNYKNYHTEIKLKDAGEVTEEEVGQVIEEMLSYRATKTVSEDGKEETTTPELTEEVIKSLGVESGKEEDLKEKIKENLKIEKDWRAQELRRTEILEKLVAETAGSVPASITDNELVKMKEKVEGDLAQMGVSFSDYLKHMKLTEEEWKEKERANAEKAAKLQLALLQVAKDADMFPSKESIEKEVAHLKMHYPQIDEERLRGYCEERMTNTFVAEYIVNGSRPNEEELFKVDHDHSEHSH